MDGPAVLPRNAPASRPLAPATLSDNIADRLCRLRYVRLVSIWIARVGRSILTQ
jgi:hypothetical protein